MKANFKMDANYAIELNGNHLDLHNNFDFVGFDFDNKQKVLVLEWRKGNGDWVPNDIPTELTLTIDGVNYLHLIPADPEMPDSEDTCLSDFTYYSSTDRNENDCVCGMSYPEKDDDIIFKFQSGRIIRVGGENVSCKIG